MRAEDVPPYVELILPTIRAVSSLGQSAKAGEIKSKVTDDLEIGEDMLSVVYPNRPDQPVFLDRLDWARSYAKQIGALESPSRGVFLITELGKKLLALPEAEAHSKVRDLDRNFRRERLQKKKVLQSSPVLDEDDDEIDNGLDEEPEATWRDILLARLHRLSPTGFEEFVLYLLRLYGLELERVGGSGDEGIDGIGTAPLSPVLSSRVAVQVKRYDPQGKVVGRETVALFQRDAMTKGSERAILVTLGKFSGPARKAAISSAPTVDLIDGEKLAGLVLEQGLGVRNLPVVNESWFDRFD